MSELRRLARKRQTHTEYRTLVQMAVEHHTALMGLGNMLDDGKAETSAAFLSRPCPVHTVKALKYPLLFILRNAYAVILYLDDGHLPQGS